MIDSIHKKQSSILYKALCGFVALTFLTSVVLPPSYAQSVLNLPVPGTMVPPSSGFTPALMTGITIHPDNPLRFDFIMDRGQSDLSDELLKEEYTKMIKYFMASLTVPEDQLWVNLSPYEKDRMVAEGLGQTEMGRDMLAQDYLLKQLTASLMYPEKELGKKFWDRIYKKAKEQFGTTDIPVNTFNKVWIVPDEALVYEQGSSAFVIKSRLKVMLEEDYMAVSHQSSDFSHQKENQNLTTDDRRLTTQIIREIIIPAIEAEINEGRNFANLRQIYNALILATWYKQRLKDSLLGKVYVDQNKTKGIDTEDKQVNQKIYDQYIESFKKGVYNFIKEDVDSATQEVIPRKYFSGGMAWKLPGGLKTLGAFALGTLLSFGSPDVGNASALAAAAVAGDRDGVTTEFVDNGQEGNIGTAITVRKGVVQPLLLAQTSQAPGGETSSSPVVKDNFQVSPQSPRSIGFIIGFNGLGDDDVASLPEIARMWKEIFNVKFEFVDAGSEEVQEHMTQLMDEAGHSFMDPEDSENDDYFRLKITEEFGKKFDVVYDDADPGLFETVAQIGNLYGFIINDQDTHPDTLELIKQLAHITDLTDENDLSIFKRILSAIHSADDSLDMDQETLEGYSYFYGGFPGGLKGIIANHKKYFSPLASSVYRIFGKFVFSSVDDLTIVYGSKDAAIEAGRAALGQYVRDNESFDSQRWNEFYVEAEGDEVEYLLSQNFVLTQEKLSVVISNFQHAYQLSQPVLDDIKKRISNSDNKLDSILESKRFLDILKTSGRSSFNELFGIILPKSRDGELSLIRRTFVRIPLGERFLAAYKNFGLALKGKNLPIIFTQLDKIWELAERDEDRFLHFLKQFTILGNKFDNRAGTIIQGIVEGIQDKIFSKDLTDVELLSAVNFINIFENFSSELYQAYHSNSDKEKFVEVVNGAKKRIIADQFDKEDIRGLKKFSGSDDVYKQYNFIAGIILSAIPQRDTSFLRKFEAIELLRSEFEREEDLRQHIPPGLRNYSQTKRLNYFEKIKQGKVDFQKDIERWIHRLTVKEETKEEKKTIVPQAVLEKAMLSYGRGDLSQEELKQTLEEYVRSSESVQDQLKQLKYEVNPYTKYSKLSSIIEYLLKDELAAVSERVQRFQADSRSSTGEASRASSKAILKQIQKNPNIPDMGIDNILRRYDTETLVEIVKNLEAMPQDHPLTKRIEAAISRLMAQSGEVVENIKHVRPVNLEGIWSDEIGLLNLELDDYQLNNISGGEVVFSIVKGKPYRIWGINCGVCVAKDQTLWDDPFFFLASIRGKGGRIEGFIHLYDYELTDGRKILLVPGINPTSEYLSIVNENQLLDQIIDFLGKVGEAGDYDAVYLPVDPFISSNKHVMRRALKKKEFTPTTLAGLTNNEDQELDWNNGNYKVSEVYVIYEKTLSRGSPSSQVPRDESASSPVEMEEAMTAFEAGDYDAALRHLDQLAVMQTQPGVIEQLRAVKEGIGRVKTSSRRVLSQKEGVPADVLSKIGFKEARLARLQKMMAESAGMETTRGLLKMSILKVDAVIRDIARETPRAVLYLKSKELLAKNRSRVLDRLQELKTAFEEVVAVEPPEAILDLPTPVEISLDEGTIQPPTSINTLFAAKENFWKSRNLEEAGGALRNLRNIYMKLTDLSLEGLLRDIEMKSPTMFYGYFDKGKMLVYTNAQTRGDIAYQSGDANPAIIKLAHKISLIDSEHSQETLVAFLRGLAGVETQVKPPVQSQPAGNFLEVPPDVTTWEELIDFWEFARKKLLDLGKMNILGSWFSARGGQQKLADYKRDPARFLPNISEEDAKAWGELVEIDGSEIWAAIQRIQEIEKVKKREARYRPQDEEEVPSAVPPETDVPLTATSEQSGTKDALWDKIVGKVKEEALKTREQKILPRKAEDVPFLRSIPREIKDLGSFGRFVKERMEELDKSRALVAAEIGVSRTMLEQFYFKGIHLVSKSKKESNVKHLRNTMRRLAHSLRVEEGAFLQKLQELDIKEKAQSAVKAVEPVPVKRVLEEQPAEIAVVTPEPVVAVPEPANEPVSEEIIQDLFDLAKEESSLEGGTQIEEILRELLENDPRISKGQIDLALERVMVRLRNPQKVFVPAEATAINLATDTPAPVALQAEKTARRPPAGPSESDVLSEKISKLNEKDAAIVRKFVKGMKDLGFAEDMIFRANRHDVNKQYNRLSQARHRELFDVYGEVMRLLREPVIIELKNGAKSSSPVAEPPGGIDLNPALLDLQIKRDGNGVPLPLPQQPIETMHIDGFLPVIINITPISNLPLVLGLDLPPQEEKPVQLTYQELSLVVIPGKKRFCTREQEEIFA